MGRYVTPELLLRGLSEEHQAQLTDDAGTGEADAAVLEEAIADAEAEADAYVQAVYPLPLPSVPRLLTRIVIDLAVWHLFGRRQLHDDAVEARHKAAVKLLERIAAGEIALGIAAPPAKATGSAATNKTDADRLFGRDVLDRY
ncbi:MAG: DUF1320 domain-containing protein [Thermodesulfobacteriota bacterium]